MIFEDGGYEWHEVTTLGEMAAGSRTFLRGRDLRPVPKVNPLTSMLTDDVALISPEGAIRLAGLDEIDELISDGYRKLYVEDEC